MFSLDEIKHLKNEKFLTFNLSNRVNASVTRNGSNIPLVFMVGIQTSDVLVSPMVVGCSIQRSEQVRESVPTNTVHSEKFVHSRLLLM